MEALQKAKHKSTLEPSGPKPGQRPGQNHFKHKGSPVITAALGTVAKTQNHLSIEGLLDGYRQWGTHGAILLSHKGEGIMPRRATGEKAETVPPRGERETGRDKGHRISLPVKSKNGQK